MVLGLVRAGNSLEAADLPVPQPIPTELPEPAGSVTELIESVKWSGWSVEDRAGWTYLYPADISRRIQGWKLHVSATVLSAPQVLSACMPLLMQAQTPFKFAATVRDLRFLNDIRCPRGNSGKFITIYPRDLARLADLAAALHEVTLGMAGPAILSDARYAPGSLVHYRYGAFEGYRVLTNDGGYRDCILDPDTNPVEDLRLGVFRPPAWAAMPFGEHSPGRITETPAPDGPVVVLLRDRYEVSTAVRHANKGGVYRGRDRVTGRDVLIKEARPHVGTDAEGRDVRDYLRHEGWVLRHLAELGVAPEVVDEFEQDGHAFLVEQFLDGQSLRDRMDEAVRAGADWLTEAEAIDLTLRLVRLLRTVHGHGVVVRDLTPNNLMLLPDGSVLMIDLELAAVRTAPDEPWSVLELGHGTPGISAPEQMAGAQPDPRADLFSLGATLLHQAARLNPDLAEDEPATRPLETRLAELVGSPLTGRPVPELMRRVITGLMRTDPADRLSLDEVVRLIEPGSPVVRAEAPVIPPGTPRQRCDELITGIVAYLAESAAPRPQERPWPETSFGSRTEPCAVQHGLAGSLAVLARLITCGAPGPLDRLVDAALPRVVGHLDRAPHRLPGLYFGFSGTAWALYDLGKALDRADLTDRAVRLAMSLPVVWPNPDITHGLAGLGSCLLHLWKQTGEPDLLRRVTVCAENVLAAADPDTDGRFWTVPTSFDSELAGYRSYGFAHGVAGIGAFLSAAADAADREDFATAAAQCADTLLNAGVGTDGGALHWPDQPGSTLRRVWWCNGSAGVGTFLCRLYVRTGDARYRAAAIAAARAVMAARWDVGTAYCHGLAGNGDFLLDLALATGDETFTDWATVLADLLWVRRTYRDGHAVLPDEDGKQVTGGFGAGLAGHLAFLTRMRFGGPRLFHPE